MSRQLKMILWILLITLAVFSSSIHGQVAEASTRKSMVLVVDTSGSMKGIADEVKGALSAFIDGLQSGRRVILVRFDVFSEMLEQVELNSQADRERLKHRLNGLHFVGQKTNFDEGIKGAQAALFQAGIVANADVVVFSDGLSDPSHSKLTIDLVTLAQQVFPQQDNYSVYLLTVQPGINPGQQATTQGNVTVQAVSRHTIPEILAVIERQADSGLTNSAVVSPPPDQEVAPESRLPIQERNWPWYLYTAMALVLLIAGAVAYWAMGGSEWLFTKRKRDRAVNLQVYGRPDSRREFWLGEGESLRIGGGICEYSLNVAATANLTRQNGSLVVCPADAKSEVAVGGQRLQGSTTISPGAAIILDNRVCVEVSG